MITYYSDGKGRDYYITCNNGGLLRPGTYTARSTVQHEHAFDLSASIPKHGLAAQPWGTPTPRKPHGQPPQSSKHFPTSTQRADYAWPVVKQKANALMSPQFGLGHSSMEVYPGGQLHKFNADTGAPQRPLMPHSARTLSYSRPRASRTVVSSTFGRTAPAIMQQAAAAASSTTTTNVAAPAPLDSHRPAAKYEQPQYVLLATQMRAAAPVAPQQTKVVHLPAFAPTIPRLQLAAATARPLEAGF